MEGGMIAKRWRIEKPDLRWWRLSRLMVTTKPSYRAAVHRTKLPVTHTINREEAEKEIATGKEEREKKRKEVEETVDSHLNQSDIPYSPLK